jgi:hypothetical protein
MKGKEIFDQLSGSWLLKNSLYSWNEFSFLDLGGHSFSCVENVTVPVFYCLVQEDLIFLF